jgi:tRNA-specific 2-thiouridylase
MSVRKKKVMVGMSGGVDSSVTAHLLRQEGFEVEGVSFVLYEARMKCAATACCSLAAIEDAQRTAEALGVRHHVVDLRDAFLEKVIEPFIEAYAKGLTPNPCILCNRYIKFPHLLKVADQHNAPYIATGHYARVEHYHGKVFLRKGIDPQKDQSYVLYPIGMQTLDRLILPLGTMVKEETREIARGLDLPAAKRPESQDICFVEDRQYHRFLKGLTDTPEGPIVDTETDRIIGRHQGIHLYTVGQRKRLPAMGTPTYVVRIDPRTNTVFIGPRESALIKEFTVTDLLWLAALEGHGEFYEGMGFRATVKIRSTMQDQPAMVYCDRGAVARVVFDTPQWAPAPGQSAVFYEDTRVVGGGVIQ